MNKLLLAVAALLCIGPASAEDIYRSANPFTPQSVLAANLPACTTSLTGQVYSVTDALLPLLGAVVAGGGAVSVIVRCNGTSWLIGE